MKPYADPSVFHWIELGRETANPLGKSDPAWTGNVVRHLMPAAFEAYVKVFHRIDAHYENIDRPLSLPELAILGIPECATLRKVVQRLRLGGSETRLRWRDIAGALKLPFVAGLSDAWCRARLEPGCWPRYIYGPAEGYLHPSELNELAAALPEALTSQTCYYRLPMLSLSTTDQPILYEGRLDEITAFPLAGLHNAPEYWWSSSHEWCVCSDYDLAFTVIGGSRRCISRLFTSNTLEVIEIGPDFRVDVYGHESSV